MSKYTVYLDIGNTNTKIGVAEEAGPLQSYTISSAERQTPDELGLTLVHLLGHQGVKAGDIRDFVGSSVVPPMSAAIRQACSRFFGKRLLLAPEDIPIPLKNLYARKHEVGSDRLVGAYAARRLFPSADSIILVDYGTATTFDCVQEDSYLGGLICPGVTSSASALATRTAKLPQISLEIKGDVLLPGCSTATSLNHGFIFGFAAMTEGLVARLRKNLAGTALVIGTGGFAQALSRVTGCFDEIRPDLLLEGLRMLYTESTAATRPE